MAKSRKALLNLPLKPTAKKQRYDDQGRINLRKQILKTATNFNKLPALSKKINGHLFIHENEMDEGEKL